eukprot:1158035-Pelagomonas_calceolata.AAC.7
MLLQEGSVMAGSGQTWKATPKIIELLNIAEYSHQVGKGRSAVGVSSSRKGRVKAHMLFAQVGFCFEAISLCSHVGLLLRKPITKDGEKKMDVQGILQKSI